jgi:YHS domain-containing protein
MLRTVIKFAVAALLACQAAVSFAADEVFVSEDGAIRGYDPVAYHEQGKAVKGDKAIALTWNGAEWYFATEAHRAAFKAEPERYAPRYGGFCAYGTANGYKVSSDPQAFAVVDGKLYLNYSKAVQTTWNGDRAKYIGTADGNWRTLEHAAYVPGPVAKSKNDASTK